MAGVVGRDGELGVVRAFLGGIDDRSSALVLVGPAGIGKTILWDSGVAEAEQSLANVLTCRGVEAEATLSFAGLSELLAPVLGRTLESLPTPRRRALEVALLLEEPGDVISEPLAVGLAVLDVLRALAREGPFLIGIDDLQWLDPASCAILQIALRRQRHEPIGLLVTVREMPDVAVPMDVDRCFAAARLRRLRLGPLSLGVLHSLLREQLGLDLPRPDLVRVHEATAGNPLFALELGRELTRPGTRLHRGEPWPVSGSLRQLLGMRLSRLSVGTHQVLLIAALAGRPTTAVIAAAHGDAEQVSDALDEASAAGVVELAAERVRFAHPLLAAVVHEQAPPGERRRVHQALAEAVADLEERARHRAQATVGQDPAVAAEVAAAADHAAARGATAAGAELCELSAALDTHDVVAARRRMLRAAHLHRLAGDGSRAVLLLEQLLAEATPGFERSDVLSELAMTFALGAERHAGGGAVSTIIELLDQALVDATGDDARAARILGNRAGFDLWRADGRRALSDARAALERAERVGDPPLLAMAIARTALAESYVAEITPGLLERGVEIEQGLGPILEYYQSPRHELSRLLLQLGEIERPRVILESMAEAAAARGDEGTRLMVMSRLGMLEWLAGRWHRALEHAKTAHELVEQTQHSHGRLWIGRVKALIEADLGLVEEARASARESHAYAESVGNEFFAITSLGSLGRVELALGDYEAARRYLGDLPGRLHAGGIDDPTIPVWEDAIETLVAVGDPERARAYLECFEVNGQRLQSRWAIAAAARCRGQLAASEGELPAALAAVERGLVELAGLACPFEHGRSLLVLGSVRRQAQQKSSARDALEQAFVIFESLGARLWAEKASSELARISGRARAATMLTETEHQVAALASEGLTNKEIAARLYMGVSTVEAHLSHVYRKLGVRRAGLATRLVLEADSPAKGGASTAQT